MRQSVLRFCGILKGAQLVAAGEAEQYHGSRFRHAGYCAELTGLGVKRTAHRETARGAAPTELIEVEHAEA